MCFERSIVSHDYSAKRCDNILSVYTTTLLEILDVLDELSITPIVNIWGIKCDKVMQYKRIRECITGEMPFPDI